MRRSFLSILITVLAVVAASSSSLAAENPQYEPPMISRTASGTLNKESVVALHRLSKAAQREGSVTVWVTLSSTYLPAFLGQLTEEQLAEQSNQVSSEFDLILDPLLLSGNVAHPRGTPMVYGPSCLIRTDKRGLKALVDDLRIGQVVGRL